MKKCYIFLDIDGVLNNTKKWEKTYKKYGVSAGTHSFDEKNIKNLLLLHDCLSANYEIHYILSSTWRLTNSGYTIAYERLRENGLILEGWTDREHDDRGAQICKFLNNKRYDLAVILDDDEFDIAPYLTNRILLLKTNTNKGLTLRNVVDFLLKL